MAKKKSVRARGEPEIPKAAREPRTQIRASETCAAAIIKVAMEENLSTAEWLDAHVLPLTQKRYREVVLGKAKDLKRAP
ncbi:MAG TPA: hypothetical protein VKA15_20720 [Isosphaeraceae bacterium]|nr:hypothetical protein [Isosphaeraceae bacterium]